VVASPPHSSTGVFSGKTPVEEWGGEATTEGGTEQGASGHCPNVERIPAEAGILHDQNLNWVWIRPPKTLLVWPGWVHWP